MSLLSRGKPVLLKTGLLGNPAINIPWLNNYRRRWRVLLSWMHNSWRWWWSGYDVMRSLLRVKKVRVNILEVLMHSVYRIFNAYSPTSSAEVLNSKELFVCIIWNICITNESFKKIIFLTIRLYFRLSYFDLGMYSPAKQKIYIDLLLYSDLMLANWS